MLSKTKRELLASQLPEQSMCIIVGKSEILRNGDVYYPFRQDSDFLLLTGLNIPDLKLLAIKENHETKWILYSDPITEKEELWGTSRISHEEIKNKSGIEEVRTYSEWKSDVKIFAEKAREIFVRASEEKKIKRELSKYQEKFASLETGLIPLRMGKTEEEIKKMKKAISVTKLALDEVERNLFSYDYEREIEADIARIYRKNGCTEAYPTIVASGPNACTLHYTRSDRKIESGDLILIDTGAEFEGYAADITRTFTRGKMNERKQEIYDAVRVVQEEAIRNIQPGRTWDEHEEVMRKIMNQQLRSLGLLRENTNGEEENLVSRKYFPHRMSHFLGLDVHDVGERSTVLKPGMVITIEPGIYINDEGIGVRIEDDILITESGCEVLSREIPK